LLLPQVNLPPLTARVKAKCCGESLAGPVQLPPFLRFDEWRPPLIALHFPPTKHSVVLSLVDKAISH
jgi:hypothetical protein